MTRKNDYMIKVLSGSAIFLAGFIIGLLIVLFETNNTLNHLGEAMCEEKGLGYSHWDSPEYNKIVFHCTLAKQTTPIEDGYLVIDYVHTYCGNR
jgi:hypothetical protein